jgi:alkylhydroperoxidase family enzyme
MQKLDGNIIEALRTGEAIADSKLEALRNFTQSVVEKRGWIEEQDVEAFINAGYSKAQLLEIIVGVAQKTLSNYINHVVQTPLDEAFQPNKWEKVKA